LKRTATAPTRRMAWVIMTRLGPSSARTRSPWSPDRRRGRRAGWRPGWPGGRARQAVDTTSGSGPVVDDGGLDGLSLGVHCEQVHRSPSGYSSGGKTRSLPASTRRIRPCCDRRSGPAGLLRELPDRRLGHLVDELDRLRQPPLGHPRLQPGDDLLLGKHLPRADHHARQRPFHPPLGRHGDHSRLDDRRWAITWFSSSTEEIHSPPDLIRSFVRSTSFT